ncbi:MAG: hypothetical protein E6Q40_11450 [Cupriavidus sp.]|nr:MAG: hypothetical protein E6Q40_11450 [Cupriavidus sp.]
MKRVKALIAVLTCTLWSAGALAWGAQGHRITGAAAEQMLSARARIVVGQILNGGSLADAATWMDEERRSLGPKVGKWHYNNIPVCGSPVARCDKGDCLTERLPSLFFVLKDKGAPREKRAEALRMILHMVGDIHQPLHAADNDDRGGNSVEFQVGPRGGLRSLHEIWDVDLVKANVRGQSESRYVSQMLEQMKADGGPAKWAGGTASQWAVESNRVARQVAYGPLMLNGCGVVASGGPLTEAYVANGRQAVQLQLIKASVRIAAVLNTALDPE